MKLSTKGRYAVMALTDLALYNNNGPVSLRDISLRQNISLLYLEQIFLRLKKYKIVKSIRGTKGGYKLERKATEIKLSEILSAVDENIKTSFLSWTTTPWTIPGNVALSVNPNLDYSLLEVNTDNSMQCLIICKDLIDSVLERCSISDFTILSTKPGSILESAEAKHPYFDRKSTVIL